MTSVWKGTVFGENKNRENCGREEQKDEHGHRDAPHGCHTPSSVNDDRGDEAKEACHGDKRKQLNKH